MSYSAADTDEKHFSNGPGQQGVHDEDVVSWLLQRASSCPSVLSPGPGVMPLASIDLQSL